MANVTFYIGPSGQTLYVRIQNPAGNYVATALSEGTSGGEGKYYASDSTIAALTGMSSASTGNGCEFRVYTGGTPSTTATDPIVSYGFLPWSGTAELSTFGALLATTNGADTVGDQIASSSTVGTVSAYIVDAKRTWYFDSPNQVTAPNTIVENIGFVGLLQMDFGQPIPTLGSISSIAATSFADVSNATEPTISSAVASADRKKVVLSISAASATAATYTITVKIVTTDSQTVVRKGRLTVQ